MENTNLNEQLFRYLDFLREDERSAATIKQYGLFSLYKLKTNDFKWPQLTHFLKRAKMQAHIQEVESRLTKSQGNREYKSRLFSFILGREENKKKGDTQRNKQ